MTIILRNEWDTIILRNEWDMCGSASEGVCEQDSGGSLEGIIIHPWVVTIVYTW